MVQRKVANKLGIQADHVKSEKLLANLKPSFFQNQDGKNRAADLKRKMKKTRSIKLSDIESLTPSPTRRNISQPGKPPPLGVPAAAAIPQKQQPPIKASDVSPNYMKPTSCFEARKEQSQGSLRNTQTDSESKNISRRSSSSSKPSSPSGNKPARALTRTSSLKFVRTLTKTPSFKPVRFSAKKSSRVVLCDDTKAQRATCSSTLKDSKFPVYLMLSPGATESEGTSVPKVCPYTYCSLNGHRHSPLPPLKCFLSAKRRSLKTQKSTKMEVLSPKRPKPSSEGTEEIDTPKLIFEGKPTHKKDDFCNLATLPFSEDGGVDYFVEIYAKIKEEDAEATGKETHGFKEEKIDVAGDTEEQNDTISTNDWGDEIVAVYRDKQEVSGSLSDGSPEIDVDFEVKIEEHGDADDFLRIFAQENTNMGTTFCTDGDFEREWAGSEVTDMEWEEGHHAPSEQESEADYSIKIDAEYDLHVGCSIDKNPDFLNEYVIISDDIVSSCNEVILAYVPRELFAEEESACSEVQSDEGDSELDGLLSQNLEIHEYGLAFERINCNQMSSNENAFEESKTAEDENGQSGKKLISTEMIPSAPMEEESFVEPSATSEDSNEKNGVEAGNLIPETNSQLGDDETNCTSKATDEASNDEQMHTTLQDAGDGIEQKEQADDANITVEIQAFDLSWAYSEAKQVSIEEDNDKSHKMALACQPDDTAEDWNSSENIDGDVLAEETQTNVSDGHSDSSDAVEDHNLDKGQREAKSSKISSSMDDEGQSNPRLKKSNSAEVCIEVKKMEVEDKSELEVADALKIVDGITGPEKKATYLPAGCNPTQELPDSCNSQKWTTRCKRRITDEEELRKFNPREPNYLPIVPDPEAEKVDLKHQMEDERRNAEEWMLDYHLQQAVTKLAPARKKKVALLVEAFETVMPTSKYETRLRNTTAFVHARPMQACS